MNADNIRPRLDLDQAKTLTWTIAFLERQELPQGKILPEMQYIRRGFPRLDPRTVGIPVALYFFETSMCLSSWRMKWPKKKQQQ